MSKFNIGDKVRAQDEDYLIREGEVIDIENGTEGLMYYVSGLVEWKGGEEPDGAVYFWERELKEE